jgi:hypothetical protein
VVHGPSGRADRRRRAQARLTPSVGASGIGARLTVLAAAIAVALIAVACAIPSPSSSGTAETIRRLRVVSSVRPLTDDDLTSLARDAEVALQAAGVVDPSAVATNEGLEIAFGAGVSDPDTVLRQVLLAEGSMRILDPGDTIPDHGAKVDPGWPVLMDGSTVDGTTVHLARDDQGLRVLFSVRPEAAAAFSGWTSEHVGQAFVIALDDRVLSAPVIQSAIRLEDMAIATPTDEDAVRLAAALRTAGGISLVPVGG